MNFLDKIAFNKLISIIANFILGVIKIVAPKSIDDIEIPKPKRPKIFPWRKKDD